MRETAIEREGRERERGRDGEVLGVLEEFHLPSEEATRSGFERNLR